MVVVKETCTIFEEGKAETVKLEVFVDPDLVITTFVVLVLFKLL
jgi:hypothetical protein